MTHAPADRGSRAVLINLVSLPLLFLLLPMTSHADIATSYMFPQVAVGQFGDGTIYKSAIMVQAQIGGTMPADCTLRFYGVTPTLPGLGTNTNFNFTVATRGWFYATTDASGPFQTGYATLTCSDYVYANMQYSLYSGGSKLGEATVFGITSGNQSFRPLFVADQTEEARIGGAASAYLEKSLDILLAQKP